MTNDLPPWQQPLFQQWQHLRQQHKIPHAILLYGASGLGKSALVKAMMQEMWCESHTACGQCRHCHFLLQDAHPDAQWLKPEAPGKAIKIDAVREASAWLQLSPLNTPQKILVIQSAENLNIAASNALLKSLEEPPESGFIFLISEMPQHLLATVRSRCYKMLLMLPSESFLRDWLKVHAPGNENMPLMPGLGPYALMEEMSGEKKEAREKMMQILESVFHKKMSFLNAGENLKSFPPMQILALLYEFMLKQVWLNPMKRQWFEFETQWLTTKRALINHQNLNWPLQLELLLEKL